MASYIHVTPYTLSRMSHGTHEHYIIVSCWIHVTLHRKICAHILLDSVMFNTWYTWHRMLDRWCSVKQVKDILDTPYATCSMHDTLHPTCHTRVGVRGTSHSHVWHKSLVSLSRECGTRVLCVRGTSHSLLCRTRSVTSDGTTQGHAR